MLTTPSDHGSNPRDLSVNQCLLKWNKSRKCDVKLAQEVAVLRHFPNALSTIVSLRQVSQRPSLERSNDSRSKNIRIFLPHTHSFASGDIDSSTGVSFFSFFLRQPSVTHSLALHGLTEIYYFPKKKCLCSSEERKSCTSGMTRGENSHFETFLTQIFSLYVRMKWSKCQMIDSELCLKEVVFSLRGSITFWAWKCRSFVTVTVGILDLVKSSHCKMV